MLRRILLIFFIPIFLISNSHASSLMKAHEYYQSGDYAQAYEIYQQLPSKTADVLYNMGNCAYKQGRFGYALLHWKQAERLWGLRSGRYKLVQNIALVKKQSIQTKQKPDSGLTLFFDVLQMMKMFFYSIIISTPLFYLQSLVLLIWILLFMYIRMLLRAKKRLLLAVLFCLFSLSASMLALKYSLFQTETAIVINKNCPFFSGPGKNFALLGHLPEAQEIVIIKESGDYYKVRIAQYTGWVEKIDAQKV